MTYAEYKARGGILTQAGYENASTAVLCEIDRITQGRASKLSPEPEQLKALIVALCDNQSAYDTDTDDKCRAYRRERIRDCLSLVKDKGGVPLCYRGFDV